MHNRRSLIALALVSVISVLAVVLDSTCQSERRPHSRLVIPDFASLGQVVGLTWKRAGEDPLTVVRAGDGDFTLPDSERAVLDQPAVRAVIETLIILSHARRVTLTPEARNTLGLVAPALSLVIEFTDGRRLTLDFGKRLTETDRVWVGLSRRPATGSTPVYTDGYLIDGHLARALDRRDRDLRKRQIFPVFHEHIERIEIVRGDARLHIAGQPARVQVGRHSTELATELTTDLVTMAPAAFATLTDELAELTIAAFARPSPSARHTVEIAVTSGSQVLTLRAFGPCSATPDMQLCQTSIGWGCVPSASLAALTARLDQPAGLLAETALAGIRPVAMTLIQPGQPATRIQAAGRAWTWSDSSDATPDVESSAVDAWLEHLERASANDYIWPSERTSSAADEYAERLGVPVMTIDVTRASGRGQSLRVYRAPASLKLDVATAFLLRRGSEPGFLALASGPNADALLPVHPMRFQRQQLISREPFGLRSVTVTRDGSVVTRLVRGQMLDEWRVEIPAGERVQPDTIDSLRELARLRASSFVSDRRGDDHGLNRPRARVRLVFDPGPFDEEATSRDYTLTIGAPSRPSRDGCYAHLDTAGPVFTISRAECTLLTQPLTQPKNRPTR